MLSQKQPLLPYHAHSFQTLNTNKMHLQRRTRETLFNKLEYYQMGIFITNPLKLKHQAFSFSPPAAQICINSHAFRENCQNLFKSWSGPLCFCQTGKMNQWEREREVERKQMLVLPETKGRGVLVGDTKHWEWEGYTWQWKLLYFGFAFCDT